MKTYEMKGGGTFQADGDQDIIDKLRELSFDPCESRQQFMQGTSQACATQTGAIIATYSKQQFVIDLLHHGFLKEVKPAEIYPTGD